MQENMKEYFLEKEAREGCLAIYAEKIRETAGCDKLLNRDQKENQ